MPIFVVLVAVLLALLSLLLHRRLAVAPGWSAPVRRAAGVALALGWACALAGFALQAGVLDPRPVRWVAWAGFTWLALAWYLLLGTALLAVVMLALRATGRAAHRRRVLRVGTPLLVVAALGTTAYGLGEAASPTVTPVTVTRPGLPAELDGLRVALVTDLHVGPVRDAGFTRRVVEQVNAQRPDVVVLGGDLVDGKVSQVADALAPLADLEAPLGTFAVTGNHEFISQEADSWMDHWETLGIDVLRNENVTLTKGSTSFHVAGIHDVTGRGDDAPDPARALDGIPADDLTLFVAHQPVSAQDVQGRGVDLQVSGHTHGGQLWPFRYAVLLQQPVVDGLDAVGDVPVLTSRGAGAWGPPVRVLAPPQIPVVTLRAG
ncbi:metallophosphoesterase [Terrabacter aeriphilus]|uniref:Metallophosphoesterase n=1 Tax=Terrabacter aeriphilus TaxID=515662 RepID=A0ABP9J1T4_9MICO